MSTVTITDPEHPLHHIYLCDVEAEVERIIPPLFNVLCDLGEIANRARDAAERVRRDADVTPEQLRQVYR